MVGLLWVEHSTNGLWVRCSNQHELESHSILLYMHYTMYLLYTHPGKNTTKNSEKPWEMTVNSGGFWEIFGVFLQFWPSFLLWKPWDQGGDERLCSNGANHSPTILPQSYHSSLQWILYTCTAGYSLTWGRYSGVLSIVVHAAKYSRICYSGAFCAIVYIVYSMYVLCAHSVSPCLSLYIVLYIGSVYVRYFWACWFFALSRCLLRRGCWSKFLQLYYIIYT